MDSSSPKTSTNLSSKPIVLASRASALAQVQTNAVRDALQAAHPDLKFETSFMITQGDKNKIQPLRLLGGKSLWTKELEDSLLQGDVDILVHCLKDVPTILPPGCELETIMEREDPVDCLIVRQGLTHTCLEDLPEGSVIGTSSVRRIAQLRKSFPKLLFQDIRGNLDTRLAKLDDPTNPFAAIVLAKAGLVRLGWANRITCDLKPPTVYYAVGQAALGAEYRSGDVRIKRIIETLTHWQTEWKCRAERAYLRVLEGGCSVPVGVETSIIPGEREGRDAEEKKGMLTITGTVTGLEGTPHVELTMTEEVATVEDAEALGGRLAEQMISQGALTILEEINKGK